MSAASLSARVFWREGAVREGEDADALFTKPAAAGEAQEEEEVKTSDAGWRMRMVTCVHLHQGQGDSSKHATVHTG